MTLLSRVAAPFRRHPIWTLAAIGIVALFAVPVLPLRPECEYRPGRYEEVRGELTPEFRNEFKSWLRDENAYFWDIGGLILIPLFSNPFDSKSGVFLHYIFDTSTKIAMNLARDSSVRLMIEQGTLPPDYRIPEHVKPFSARMTGPGWAIPSDQRKLAYTCEFIRAVALKRSADAR